MKEGGRALAVGQGQDWAVLYYSAPRPPISENLPPQHKAQTHLPAFACVLPATAGQPVGLASVGKPALLDQACKKFS